MSSTRDKLIEARRGYETVRYPGDLAADVFARIDAGEHHAADTRLDDVDADTLQKINPMRIGVGSTQGTSTWRPLLAIAATVAVLASAIAVLVHTRTDPTQVAVVLPTQPVAVEPQANPTVATKSEENVDFTIVPSFQSFALSTPTSLAPASMEEYDRQERETSTTEKKAAAVESSTAVQ